MAGQNTVLRPRIIVCPKSGQSKRRVAPNPMNSLLRLWHAACVVVSHAPGHACRPISGEEPRICTVRTGHSGPRHRSEYGHLRASTQSATVAITSAAHASEAVRDAAPKVAESVVSIGKSADAIAADVKREADSIIKPKHWYEKILGPVYTVGKLRSDVLVNDQICPAQPFDLTGFTK